MTVLVSIPQSMYSDAEARKIFTEIVRDFKGSAATGVSAFENDNYKLDGDDSGIVNMGEFDLPSTFDLSVYDAKKHTYEKRYESIAITMESRDNYPIHNFDDINVAGS